MSTDQLTSGVAHRAPRRRRSPAAGPERRPPPRARASAPVGVWRSASASPRRRRGGDASASPARQTPRTSSDPRPGRRAGCFDMADGLRSGALRPAPRLFLGDTSVPIEGEEFFGLDTDAAASSYGVALHRHRRDHPAPRARRGRRVALDRGRGRVPGEGSTPPSRSTRRRRPRGLDDLRRRRADPRGLRPGRRRGRGHDVDRRAMGSCDALVIDAISRRPRAAARRGRHARVDLGLPGPEWIRWPVPPPASPTCGTGSCSTTAGGRPAARRVARGEGPGRRPAHPRRGARRRLGPRAALDRCPAARRSGSRTWAPSSSPSTPTARCSPRR